MSRDYRIFWTVDLPTPSDFGLGTDLLPWPSAESPWPRSAKERAALGYPEAGDDEDEDEDGGESRDWDLVRSSTKCDRASVPKAALEVLGGRSIVRVLTVQNDDQFALDLARAGAGVCVAEGTTIVYPQRGEESEDADVVVSAAAKLWVSLHRRPSTRCRRLVEAAARNDPAAVAVLHAWALEPMARPNLGCRRMSHDRELCERVYDAAAESGPSRPALLSVLVAHRYFPAGRRPELARLAREANVDVAAFIDEARRDGEIRQRWFGIEEPVD